MAELYPIPQGSSEGETPGGAAPHSSGEFKTIPWWWLVLALATALILAAFFVGGVWLSIVPLELFILGISIAAALDPLIDIMCKKMNRLEAIILVYLLGLALLVAILWLVIPTMVKEAQALLQTVPGLIDSAQQTLNQNGFLSNLNIINEIKSQIGSAANLIISLPMGLFYSLFEIIVIVFVSLYALALEPGIQDFYFSLFPHKQRERVAYILAQTSAAMGGYVRASFLDGLAMGAFAYVGFLIIGVDFALVLAVMTALLELIPTMGPLIAGTLATAFALLQSPTKALIVLAFFIVLQQLETHILVPNVMRTQTEISPLAVVFALLVGYEIGGLLGALAAIPIAGMVKVTIGEFIAPAIRRRTGAKDLHQRPSEVEEEEREHERNQNIEKDEKGERK